MNYKAVLLVNFIFIFALKASVQESKKSEDLVTKEQLQNQIEFLLQKIESFRKHMQSFEPQNANTVNNNQLAIDCKRLEENGFKYKKDWDKFLQDYNEQKNQMILRVDALENKLYSVEGSFSGNMGLLSGRIEAVEKAFDRNSSRALAVGHDNNTVKNHQQFTTENPQTAERIEHLSAEVSNLKSKEREQDLAIAGLTQMLSELQRKVFELQKNNADLVLDLRSTQSQVSGLVERVSALVISLSLIDEE